MINPGKYNIKISFLKREAGQDDYGEPVDTWDVFKGAWANKFDFIGTDFYASQTESTKVEVKFRCRYLTNITKDMRVQQGTNIYEIVGTPIDIDNKHAELLIYCKAVTD